MIQGIKYGRVEKIVDGATTYWYMHPDHNASDDATDWITLRIVVDGSNTSYVMKKGSFGSYTDDWTE